MATPKRPLSPHLQIYRPQWTSVLSILHRIAGIIMAIGGVLVAWWLWAVADGGGHYQFARDFFASLVGQGLLLAWSICTFYHLCNGIRHLVWDIGVGLSLPAAFRSGVLVVVATAILTALAWLL